MLRQVPQNDLIEEVALELQKMIKAPEWAAFVKTGAHKERPPLRSDWWYVRAAAILRSVYLLGPIGVSKLRTKYGGKKNRGFKPERFVKGSGAVIRKILQQLEEQGLVKQGEKGVHKGRIITPKGVSLLSQAAKKVSSKVNIDKDSGKKASPKADKKAADKAEKNDEKKEKVEE